MKFPQKMANSSVLVLLILGLMTTLYSTIEFNKNTAKKIMMSEVQEVSTAIKEFRSVYTSEVVARLQNTGIEVSHDYLNKDNAIPLPATLSMHIGKNLSAIKGGSTIKLYSPFPFPNRAKDGGLKDQFAKNAWTALVEDPGTPYIETTEADGLYKIKYATGDVLNASCVNCHNTHPNTPKTGWKTGDLRGILEVQKEVLTSSLIAGNSNYWSIFKIILPLILVTVILLLVMNRLKTNTLDLSASNKILKNNTKLLNNSIQDLNDIGRALAHDLKTPIIGISSLTSHIEDDLDGKITPEITQNLALIRSRTLGMNQIIDGFRHYLKLSNTQPDIRPYSLRDLINSLQFDPTVHITTDLSIDFIQTDPKLLLLVLEELVANATTHNPEPHKNVSIIASGKDGELIICVLDNGPGIAATYFDKVIRPLQTLEVKKSTKGIGIGLALVAKVTRKLNGKLEFTNLTKGFKVTISLPNAVDSRIKC